MTDAESILREILNKILRKLNYNTNDVKIKAISTGGANYTSTLFLITVAEASKQQLNLFAKVATVGEKMRDTMNASRMFSTECFVYEKLTKIYNELEVKHQVAEEERFVFPKYYGSNQKLYEETLVLDNLVAQGYNTYNRFETIGWEYASAAVKTLAQFHALSFAFHKESPEEFDRVTQEYKMQSHMQNDDQMNMVFDNMIKRNVESLSDEDARNRVEKFMADHKRMFVNFNSLIGTPVVLAHGDYRPSNLMYKKDAPAHQIILVDYQTLYAGCPATDLVYFIIMGSDAAFRARYYDRLIEHYYLHLSSSMKKLGVDSTEVYPREKFDKDLKSMLPYGLMIAVTFLPIITVDAENAPRMDSDDADMSEFCIKTNDNYAERLKGIVDDCIKWGVI